MLLAGKVAIVTRAAQGIGRACAERLAKEGAKIVLCDVARAKGETTSKAIAGRGGTARFVTCDVAKPAEVATAVDAAFGAYGRIDSLNGPGRGAAVCQAIQSRNSDKGPIKTPSAG
jgi:NAD(P)-dependent dehydrogenase (short-subunit alcohol dehydrogenase family)